MKKRDQIDWSVISNFLAGVGGIAAILSVVWSVSPNAVKGIAFVIACAILLVVTIMLLFNGVVRAVIQKHIRLLRMSGVALLIPATHYFFSDRSLSVLISSSIEMFFIIIVIQMSKEWRTAKPLRSPIIKDEPFQWGGVTEDQVGRGLDGREPDGASDAMFILNLSKSNKTITKIYLNRLNADDTYTGQHWGTGKDRDCWVLGIMSDNKRIDPNRSGILDIKLERKTKLLLFASDRWYPSHWFDQGQKYELEVHYAESDKPTQYILTISYR